MSSPSILFQAGLHLKIMLPLLAESPGGISADSVSAPCYVGTHHEQLPFINSSTGATFSLSFNLSFLDLPFPRVHVLQIMNMLMVACGCPVLTQSTCARREAFFSCSLHMAWYYHVPFSFSPVISQKMLLEHVFICFFIPSFLPCQLPQMTLGFAR